MGCESCSSLLCEPMMPVHGTRLLLNPPNQRSCSHLQPVSCFSPAVLCLFPSNL